MTTTLYDPTLENYFERCLTLFEHWKPVPHLHKPKSKNAVFTDLMGVRGRLSPEQVPAFTKFVAEVSRKHPRMLPKAIRLAALGYHFEKITRQQIAIHDFKEFLAEELESFKEDVTAGAQQPEHVDVRRQRLFADVDTRYRSIPGDFRYHSDGIDTALDSFRVAINAQAAEQARLPAA